MENNSLYSRNYQPLIATYFLGNATLIIEIAITNLLVTDTSRLAVILDRNPILISSEILGHRCQGVAQPHSALGQHVETASEDGTSREKAENCRS